MAVEKARIVNNTNTDTYPGTYHAFRRIMYIIKTTWIHSDAWIQLFVWW